MMDSWAGPAGFPFWKLCVFTPAELEYGMSLHSVFCYDSSRALELMIVIIADLGSQWKS